jgi:5-methylcytosine-specific restriction endonuclease McrA
VISGEELKRAGRKQFCVHGHDTYICGRHAGNCRNCFNEHTKQWAKKNRDKVNAGKKRFYLRHHDTELAKRNAWKKANPAKVLAATYKRRALKRNVSIGDLTEIAKVYSRAQELRNLGFDVQVDHIIPLSKNGTHEASNLQIIYAVENARKGSNLTYKPQTIFT